MTLCVDIGHDLGSFELRVSFRAEAGITALFGRSGAGKTSVVNAISGLLRPTSGRITFGEEVLFDAQLGVNLRPQQRRIGVVFQDGRLFPHLSVRENLAFGARFLSKNEGRDHDDQTARIVDLLGLGGLLSRRPGGLSGGEKQRVAIGRALLMRPKLLLMDEPLAALDGPRKDEIIPYLERLRDGAGMPIVYVSHSVAEVARLADQLVLLEHGAVMRAGPVGAVLSDPSVVPLLGIREAGAILDAKIAQHCDDGLTRLRIDAGDVFVPSVAAPIGGRIRVRVLAQDVILARNRPEGLSSRNIIEMQIDEVRMGDGPGAIIVLIAGNDRILARVTARSVAQLNLDQKGTCFAILKATAVARGDIGIVG